MAETATLTLTKFLLARIAEDEALAKDAGADAMTGWRWKAWPKGAYDEIQATVIANSRRVLAECEAKRRIVALHGTPHECPPSAPDNDLASWFGGGDDPCPTLRALAAVYADHPDHRPEWRP